MQSPSHVAEPQLNATPLIDVLLVLLVMLIFTLPIATHAVKLNLPHGPGMSPPPPTVRISIESDGAIYWDDVRMESLDSLAPRFRTVASQQIPPLVRVIPDRRAQYEIVAQVLAAAQRARIERLSIDPVADT